MEILKTIQKISKTFPISIIFFKGKDYISKLIIESENIFWKNQSTYPDYKNAQWSHVGLLIGNFFYESTVDVDRKLVYGVQRVLIDKRFSEKELKNVSQIGVIQNLNISKQQIVDIRNYCEKSIGKITYGGVELFGTLLALWLWKISPTSIKEKILRNKNPFDDPKSMYCVAFVIEALKNGLGFYPLRKFVEPSISTVDHLWIDISLECEKLIFTEK